MGESDFSTLEKVRNVEILPPSSYNKSIPEELERIALKALAKDPGGSLPERHRSARRSAGVPVHEGRAVLAQGSGRLDEEDVPGGDRGREHQGGTVSPDRGSPPPWSAQDHDRDGAEQRRHAGRPRQPFGWSGSRRPPRQEHPGRTTCRIAERLAMKWVGTRKRLDTQIFEKDPASEPEMLGSQDIFEDDDDRTVANEPPPDVLRAATAPNLATPQPRLTGRADSARIETGRGGDRSVPPACARREYIRRPIRWTASGPPAGAPKTLFGVPAANPANLPPPPAAGRPPLGSATPPPAGPRRLTRSSLSIPASALPPPQLFRRAARASTSRSRRRRCGRGLRAPRASPLDLVVCC